MIQAISGLVHPNPKLNKLRDCLHFLLPAYVLPILSFWPPCTLPSGTASNLRTSWPCSCLPCLGNLRQQQQTFIHPDAFSPQPHMHPNLLQQAFLCSPQAFICPLASLLVSATSLSSFVPFLSPSSFSEKCFLQAILPSEKFAKGVQLQPLCKQAGKACKEIIPSTRSSKLLLLKDC